MNNKVKKAGAIVAVAIIVFISSSYYYYESVKEPSGINEETDLYGLWKDIGGGFYITTLKNTSYLGNNIVVAYRMQISPMYRYVDLNNSADVDVARSDMVCSEFCMTTLTSVNWPYSNPVVTVLNTSLSVSNKIFKNGTDKNDNFGPYWTYNTCNNNYISKFSLHEKGDFIYAQNPYFVAPPISSILNPGNYTFYENITYTISLSMGYMHFTSQPYHLDESWWVVYEYHSTNINIHC